MTDTPIAAMVAKMLSTGIPPETNILAIETAELCAARPIDIAAEKRRTWDRERKRQERVHRNSADPPVHILSPLEEEIKPKKVLSMQIADDWSLTQKYIDYALKKGWANERVESESERFKNHFRASGARKKDWFLTWCNWVTSPFQQKPQEANGHGKRHGSVLDALDRLEEALRGW